jgi:hypothetical protein
VWYVGDNLFSSLYILLDSFCSSDSSFSFFQPEEAFIKQTILLHGVMVPLFLMNAKDAKSFTPWVFYGNAAIAAALIAWGLKSL